MFRWPHTVRFVSNDLPPTSSVNLGLVNFTEENVGVTFLSKSTTAAQLHIFSNCYRNTLLLDTNVLPQSTSCCPNRISETGQFIKGGNYFNYSSKTLEVRNQLATLDKGLVLYHKTGKQRKRGAHTEERKCQKLPSVAQSTQERTRSLLQERHYSLIMT